MERPFLCGSEAVPLEFDSPKDAVLYLEKEQIDGQVLYRIDEVDWAPEPETDIGAAPFKDTPPTRDPKPPLPSHWQQTVWYFLDWDENNGEQYNLIQIPRHLYDKLHADEAAAEKNGWKLPANHKGYINRYQGVRNSIEHMLQPYGSPDQYQQGAWRYRLP